MANTSKGSQPSVDSKVASGTTVADDLDFGRVVQIFLRTWPFIKPLTRHLIIFVLCSALVFIVTTFLGFVITGLVNSGIIGGQPLGGGKHHFLVLLLYNRVRFEHRFLKLYRR